MEEIYKDIPGYEWIYEVSNFGNVLSIWTRPSIKSMWRLFPGRKPRILKPRKSSVMWYLSVMLIKNWVYRDTKIHRIVASAFLWLDLYSFTDPKNSLCVCHKDDNPKNNMVDNLFLWTNKDNNHDMIKKWRRIWKSWQENHSFWKSWNMLWKFGKYHHRSIKVSKHTINGELLWDYDWIREAWRITWINFWDISKCCKWKIKSAGWFVWKFAYVGDPKVAEQSWQNNVNAFANSIQ